MRVLSFGRRKFGLILLLVLYSVISLTFTSGFAYYQNRAQIDDFLGKAFGDEEIVDTYEVEVSQGDEESTTENGSGNEENQGDLEQVPEDKSGEGGESSDIPATSPTVKEDIQNTAEQTDPDSEPDSQPEPEPEPEPDPVYPSVKVAFYADNQSDSDADDAIHQNTVNNILASGANPIFHAGDLMEDGTLDSMNRFLNITSTLRSTRTFYAALGNNDRVVGDSSTPSPYFFDNFSFPNNERWYSVNYGNLHMVILDSAFASGSQTQINWLVSDLQSDASQDRITGVIFHHPSYATTVASYLDTYGVDFVMMGHLHSYNHYTSNGIPHFVLSGQPSLGHIVANVGADNVTMTVYNNSNGVVDNVSFDER